MSTAGDVQSLVSDPRLVEERRAQILGAAVRLFAREGYYTTTIQRIAREAGVSTGLIYQYFRDKDDILFLTLKLVIDTYEREIPRQLEGLSHPVERLCASLRAYCLIVDGLREATVLAYRSTKSLRAERRDLVKEGETRTNEIFERCLRECVAGGYMRPVNEHLLAYQCVMFAHSWALKHWALREKYSLARYVSDGMRLLIAPHLTPTGLPVLEAVVQGLPDDDTPAGAAVPARGRKRAPARGTGTRPRRRASFA